jgi:hypothetical protein
MADQSEKQPPDQPGVLRQPQPAPSSDPLEGAHKDSKGVWVNKDGVPLSEADAELARQRLTAKGEPRKP